MNILLLTSMFLFGLTIFTFAFVIILRSETLYRQFFLMWVNMMGVPKEMQEKMPMEMYTKQARFASWLFIFLTFILCAATVFIFRLSFI